MDWESDGADWTNRQASGFVEAGGVRWHVQRMGRGPSLLLVHGTGATTHSWRDLMPVLSRDFAVIAPDLPGHGFSSRPRGGDLSLPSMSMALGALLEELGEPPTLVVGHSAGAAVLARMALDGRIAPGGIVALNGALLPLKGMAGHLFSPIAKVLAVSPLAARLFAWRAGAAGVIERLVDQTGSKIDETGLELYRRLAGDPDHVAAALGMMAAWDLRALERDLPRLEPRLCLVVATEDHQIPPSYGYWARSLVPNGHVIRLSGLGHLAHEEDPEGVAALIREEARSLDLLPDVTVPPD